MAFYAPDEDEDQLSFDGQAEGDLLPDDSSEFPFEMSGDSGLTPDQLQELLSQASGNLESDVVEAEPVEEEVPEVEPVAVDEEMALPELQQAKPAPSPQIDRYRQYLDEYSQLQNKRSDANLVNALIAAGGKIGQSIAGRTSGKFDPDMSGVNMLEKMADRPVQDFEQRQAVGARQAQLGQIQDDIDPASPKSALVRQYLNNSIFKDNPLPDTVSASDAQQLIKMIGRPSSSGRGGQIVRTYNQQTGQIELKVFDPATKQLQDLGETAGFAMQSRIDPRTKEVMVVNPATGKYEAKVTGPTALPKQEKDQPEVSLTRENLTAKQQELLDKGRTDLLADTKDDRSAINAAQGIRLTLESGAEIGGDILREIQNQLARGSGEKGAMTEGDVSPFGGRADVLSRIQRLASMGATGQLPDSDRKFLIDIANVMERRAKSYVENRSEFFVGNMHQDLQSAPNLRQHKISSKQVRNLLGVDSAAQNRSPGGGPPSNEEIRETSDGKKAVFDRKTKKFIRWADETK